MLMLAFGGLMVLLGLLSGGVLLASAAGWSQLQPGWTAWLLSADPELPKRIGLAASRRVPLFNGPLECRLFEIKMVAGSNRSPK